MAGKVTIWEKVSKKPFEAEACSLSELCDTEKAFYTRNDPHAKKENKASAVSNKGTDKDSDKGDK